MLTKWMVSDSKEMKRTAALWNAVSAGLSSGQVAIILVFVSHKLGLITAGMVTIAYAVANLFLCIGKYGIRNFQVTDVKEKFSFSDYFYGRIVTVIITFLMAGIYLTYLAIWGGYSPEKIVVVLEVTILKLVDAFEDVYLGRFQQMGRLDTAAKIMAVRIFLSTSVICILVLLGSSIYVALFGGIICSLIADIVFLKSTFFVARAHIGKFEREKVYNLLKICLPLCIGITLSIYIGNVPKYMIDAYMGEEIQAIFGYIMMPVFVITLLNQFIYQPFVKDLGDLWEKKDYHAFKNSVWKQTGIVLGLTLVMLVVGVFLGLPVLSVMYNANLKAYRGEFVILLLGGGAYALAYYLNVPITTIRKQNYIAIGYVLAAVLSIAAGKYLVVSFGMMGAAVLYLGVNVMLALTYLIMLLVGIKRAMEEYSKN